VAAGHSESIGDIQPLDGNAFGDGGGIHQIASMSGSVASGYTAALTIGV